MKFIRPIPQRALQAPRWSLKPSSEDTRATRPASVCSHPRKPGTFSSISPPPAEVGGPQQGGLSRPSPDVSLQLEGGVTFLMLAIFRPAPLLSFTCDMQLPLSDPNPPRQPWPPRRSGVPASGSPSPARIRSCGRRSGRADPPCSGRSWPARHCRHW